MALVSHRAWSPQCWRCIALFPELLGCLDCTRSLVLVIGHGCLPTTAVGPSLTYPLAWGCCLCAATAVASVCGDLLEPTLLARALSF